MKSIDIHIDNLKCGGCESSIINGLMAIDGVHEVKVNHDDQLVRVSVNDENDPEILQKKLTRMGYPEKGTSNTVQKAISYVSCAIGRVSGSDESTRSSSDHLS